MAELLSKSVEVAQSAAALVVGVAWANGLVSDAPLLGLIPDAVHFVLGYVAAVLGVIGIWQKMMK